jgi:thioredoxin-like negative regulator of GroEL
MSASQHFLNTLGKSFDPNLAGEFHQTRNRGNDTEHERTAVGKTQDTMKDLLTQRVMEQAMKDKMMSANMQEAINHAWHAKPEEQIVEVDSDDDPDDCDASLAAMRAARIAEMKKRAAEKQEMKANGHGEFEEVVETEFLKKVTSSQLVVCHFYHKEFERCKIMDMHLSKLARRCFRTKFMKINAEKAPFFVEKLRIRTIPTVVFFQDGIAKHHMMGFTEVGSSDEFKTATLARLLYMHEVVEDHFDSDEEFD